MTKKRKTTPHPASYSTDRQKGRDAKTAVAFPEVKREDFDAVDEASSQSFPASDPPSWIWRRQRKDKMTIFGIKRVYDPPTASDGQRVLVDRIWPRGLRKSDLGNVVWIKNIAPSSELRKWFGHRPERWEEFRRRYRAELGPNPAVEELRVLSKKKRRVTLLYSARDVKHNQAMVLASYLRRTVRRVGAKS